MARSIEAFKERIEIEVANAKANAALQQTERHVGKLTGAWKAGLGLFNKDAAESIDKVQRLGGSFTSLAGGPAGLALGAITSIGAAVGGLGVALFRLADQSAEAGDKIFELSEKSGFSAETISAFKLAAESAGSTVEEFASGLSKFNINMAEAAEGNEKLAKAFARMGVDIKQGLQDPEAALAQFMKRFAELPSNQERVIAASEIFGKKFGANLVGTFNQAGGNLDEFMRKMRELGIVIDDESAEASNDFQDMKKQFELQFGAMTRTIGFEVLPAFMTMFVEIDKGLAGNRENWKQWGKEIAGVLLTIESLTMATWRTIKSLTLQDLMPVTGLISIAYKFWREFKGSAQEVVDSYQTLSGDKFGGDITPGFLNRRKGLGLGSDREDKSAGRAARLGQSARVALDPLHKFRDILEDLQREVQFYGDNTERARVEQDFLKAGIEKLTPELKAEALQFQKLALAIANQMDQNKKRATFTEMKQSFIAKQAAQIDELNGYTRTAVDEVLELEEAIKKTEYSLDGITAAQLRANAAMIDSIKIMQGATQRHEDFHKEVIGGLAETMAGDDAFGIGWKDTSKQLVPNEETKSKWTEFFKGGLQDALGQINGMFSQQQSKKQGLFSKIVGFAAPFLSFLPGGAFLSMAAGAASSALGGDYGGAASSVAGGFMSGGAFRRRSSNPNPGAPPEPGHAAGLRYVPYDNYRARLHQGERVLTAAENRNFSGGASEQTLGRLAAAIERLQAMSPRSVVAMGAHGVVDAMDGNADLIRLMGQRQRLA